MRNPHLNWSPMIADSNEHDAFAASFQQHVVLEVVTIQMSTPFEAYCEKRIQFEKVRS